MEDGFIGQSSAPKRSHKPLCNVMGQPLSDDDGVHVVADAGAVSGGLHDCLRLVRRVPAHVHRQPRGAGGGACLLQLDGSPSAVAPGHAPSALDPAGRTVDGNLRVLGRTADAGGRRAVSPRAAGGSERGARSKTLTFQGTTYLSSQPEVCRNERVFCLYLKR